MEITEFLTARLDEIENVARSVQEVEPKSASSVFTSLSAPTGTVEMSAAYVLAEVKAKRAIVQAWAARADDDHPAISAHRTGLWLAIQMLAQPYADHQDFDPDWLA